MRVAILVVDEAFDSGLSTVHDVLGTANLMRDEVDHSPPPWETVFVGTRRHLTTAAGHRVTTVPLESLPEPPDVLVVPALGFCTVAGIVERLSTRAAKRTVGLIAAAHAAGMSLAGACTGTFLLGEAGVLDEQVATTSWWLGPAFRERYPRVHLDTSATLVAGDRISTAGAAFAHIDLALSIVHRRSPAVADLVARYLLIGDRASQASFAVPSVMAQFDPHVARFEQWVRGHLDGPVRIRDVADMLGLSERTLQRTVSAAMGMTPVELVNEIRLDEAAFLLRSTSLSMDAIAQQVGFSTAGTLRALFRRRRGTTMRQLRHQPESVRP
jgi:transcriptional regulator GlxA family with amidase domain